MIYNDYINIRSKGYNEDTPVPITPRQLEAYVRLSEASARTRLSDYVEDIDATRAIELINGVLEKIYTTADGIVDSDMLSEKNWKEQNSTSKMIKEIRKIVTDEEEVQIEDLHQRFPNSRKEVDEAIDFLYKNNEILKDGKRVRIV